MIVVQIVRSPTTNMIISVCKLTSHYCKLQASDRDLDMEHGHSLR